MPRYSEASALSVVGCQILRGVPLRMTTYAKADEQNTKETFDEVHAAYLPGRERDQRERARAVLQGFDAARARPARGGEVHLRQPAAPGHGGDERPRARGPTAGDRRAV